MTSRDPPAPASIRVWDPLLRALHGLLIAGLIGAWVTTHRWSRWHEAVGCAVLAVVAVRLAWGFVGPRRARFRSFVCGPAPTFAHARDLLRSRERRHIGHNPLGGWMVVALLGCLLVVCGSGLLFLTDRFWGDAAVSAAHEVAAWLLVGLVALHVGGVVVTGLRQRENLVAAMWHGRKRAAEAGDID